jgi:hypothetical protein
MWELIKKYHMYLKTYYCFIISFYEESTQWLHVVDIWHSKNTLAAMLKILILLLQVLIMKEVALEVDMFFGPPCREYWIWQEIPRDLHIYNCEIMCSCFCFNSPYKKHIYDHILYTSTALAGIKHNTPPTICTGCWRMF